MTRADVRELHYITYVDNVPSILQHGVLSYNEVERRGIRHVSVASAEIQVRRRKQVPGGRPLHDYANLYFNPRNPMMFKRVNDPGVGPDRLAVVRVDTAALDLPRTVIADKNASSDYVMFHGSPDGLAHLDRSLVMAEWWTDDDPIEQYRRKSAVCAEVLVPVAIPQHLIAGAYVSCDATAGVLRASSAGHTGLDIAINRHMFFQ